MQTLLRNWLMGATLILFASCNKSNTQGKYIPRDAAFVMEINGKSLSSKLPWSEIKQNPLFKDAALDSTLPTAIKQALNNPDSAGIDIGSDMAFFVVKDSMGGYLAFEGNIKNEKLFKEFNSHFTDSAKPVEKDGLTFLSKPGLCVGYSKDKFLYIFDAPAMHNINDLTKRGQQDSINTPATKKRDIVETCHGILLLDDDVSLARNEKFSKLMNESGDIHLWVNGESIMTGVAVNPMMAMIDLEKFYKGSITTATVNFENGKININGKSYVGEDFAKIYKKYSGGKISEDMLKRVPGKDIAGVMVLNFNPEVIREFLKMMNLDGVANMGLTKLGFTLDDFIKGNKGDVLIGVSDLTFKTDSTKKDEDDKSKTTLKTTPIFKYVFAASIADKDAFNKLINVGKKMGAQQLGDSAKAPFVYKTDGNYFTIANNTENANQFLSTTNNNIDFVNKINGQPFAAYLNIQSLLKSFETQSAQDSSAKIAYDASLVLWDNVFMKGGEINSEDAITQSVEINLMDKNTSSLKQLNIYAQKLSAVYKNHRAKHDRKLTTFEQSMILADSAMKEANKPNKSK